MRGIVDAHWPAQYDQAVIAVQSRLCIRVSCEVYIANAKPRLFQHGIQSAEQLVRHVLEDKEFFHGILFVKRVNYSVAATEFETGWLATKRTNW